MIFNFSNFVFFCPKWKVLFVLEDGDYVVFCVPGCKSKAGLTEI